MSTVYRALFIVLTCFCFQPLYLLSQDAKEQFDINFDSVSIPNALRHLSDVSGHAIIFSDNLLQDGQKVNGSFTNASVAEILDYLLQNTGLTFSSNNDLYVLSKRRPERFHLHGYIVNNESGERLPYALIFNKKAGLIATANEEGYYNIVLESGMHSLQISYLGHKERVIEVELSASQQMNLELNSDSYLPEVVVNESNKDQSQSEHNKYSHDDLMKLAQRTPGLGGSNDLLQTAKSMAGVQSGAGGIGGYFIRGGSNDQNLFLLDGVAIYNPFHSLGMSSIFTPQMTQSFQVIKSGFRPQYGDRSSAVLDIRLKDGNNRQMNASGGVNPQDGFLKVEGPIVNKNASFFLYGRTSTASFRFNDVIRRSLFPFDGVQNRTDFHDIIGKVSFGLGPSNKIIGTYFKSSDQIEGSIENTQIVNGEEFESQDETKLTWGNEVMNLRWQSILSDRSFLAASVSSNKYFSTYGLFYNEEYEGDVLEDFFFNEVSSQNRDVEFKLDLDIIVAPSLRLKAGLGYLHKDYMPNINYYDESSEELSDISDLNFGTVSELSEGVEFNSHKLVHYLEASTSINKLNLLFGYRATAFRFEVDNFFHFQPRLNLDYRLNENSMVYGSISNTVQYVHLLSSSEVHLPRDLWYPSSQDLPPEESWHYNLGWSQKFKRSGYFNVDIYYKNTKNHSIGSLEPGEFSNSFGELFTSTGEAESYGIETSLHTNMGFWSANWVYTASNSNLRFPDLNQGERYDFQFDRSHEFKTLHTFDITPRLVLGVNTYLSSGHPLLVTYNLDANMGLVPIDINPAGRKNSIRTGIQHRLDLSLAYSINTGRLGHNLKLNLYNAYNNSLPLYYTQNFAGDLQPEFSVPVLPSISYILRFQ